MDGNNEVVKVLQKLDSQIAGHRGKKELFKHKDGDVLKPFHDDDIRSHKELKFYKDLNNCETFDSVNLTLKTFVAEFKELWYCNEQGTSFIRLENLTEIFKMPSILDVKMGKVTYDPNASKEKIALELKKYPPVQQIGFRIAGMRVYQPDLDSFKVYGREFGKNVSPETLIPSIKKYLEGFPIRDKFFGQVILSIFIHRLDNIKNWFDSQRKYAFYSSSLFFAYESDGNILNEKLKEWNAKNLHGGDESICPLCKLSVNICQKIYSKKDLNVANVFMIDFAHVFETNNLDDNYVSGLMNLMNNLKIIIDEYC